MNPSLILRTSAPLLLALPAVVSIYILLRGHNAPGGGFVGGLFAAAGFLFFAIARGHVAAGRLIRFRPTGIAAAGIAIATASGLPAMVLGAPYLTHLWWFVDLGLVVLPLGTALIFDIGVYVTVFGMAAAIFLGLLRWQEENLDLGREQ